MNFVKCDCGGVIEVPDNQQKKWLVDYLFQKALAEDWHAVSDAANDLRVLDGK